MNVVGEHRVDQHVKEWHSKAGQLKLQASSMAYPSLKHADSLCVQVLELIRQKGRLHKQVESLNQELGRLSLTYKRTCAFMGCLQRMLLPPRSDWRLIRWRWPNASKNERYSCCVSIRFEAN